MKDKINNLATELADYILASQTESENYTDYVEDGGDPRQSIWYVAHSVMGTENLLYDDIAKYEAKNSKKTMLTSEEYVAKEGMLCPVCHGDDITGGCPEVDGSAVWANVDCNRCNAHWTDYYRLQGYDNLKEE